MVSGLIFTPALYGLNPRTGRPMVRSLDVRVEPTVGILARKVDKLSLDIRSFREPLKRAIKEVMIPSIRTNFLKHGRPRWEELSEHTIEKKGHARPLRDTDSLMDVMAQQNIWHIDGEKALIADLPQKVWYGKVHQAGMGDPDSSADMWFDPVIGEMVNVGEGEGGSIPQRRFIMLQKEDEEDIEKIFDEWLGERIRRAGLGTGKPTVGISTGTGRRGPVI